MSNFIFGCGDLGRRIAQCLISDGVNPEEISSFVRSQESASLAAAMSLSVATIDVDQTPIDLSECHKKQVYFTVAPQSYGTTDLRSRRILQTLKSNDILPAKVVLISTTGVYGNSTKEWITESSVLRPENDRGQRRLDAERQWSDWAKGFDIELVILRVPGLYAYSRLSHERFKKRSPLVKVSECGFSNRIHADDLARICVIAMNVAKGGRIYNATDGSPSTITEYLQTAAKVLGYAAMPEVSLADAPELISSSMLSYFKDSRKISNRKMLTELNVKLMYPDLCQGILVK